MADRQFEGVECLIAQDWSMKSSVLSNSAGTLRLESDTTDLILLSLFSVFFICENKHRVLRIRSKKNSLNRLMFMDINSISG